MPVGTKVQGKQCKRCEGYGIVLMDAGGSGYKDLDSIAVICPDCHGIGRTDLKRTPQHPWYNYVVRQ